jgi:hypothetical protein
VAVNKEGVHGAATHKMNFRYSVAHSEEEVSVPTIYDLSPSIHLSCAFNDILAMICMCMHVGWDCPRFGSS